MAAMRDQGVALLYMIPNPRWLPLLRRWNMFRVAVLPNYEHRLPFEQSFPADHAYAVEPVVHSPEQIDSLWNAAARQHDCIVLRDASKWPWRIADENVAAVTRGGELVAIVQYLLDGGKTLQWVIRDLLWAGDEMVLRKVLAAFFNFVQEKVHSDAEHQYWKINSVAPRALASALCEFGFTRDEYAFPLAVGVIGAGVTEDEIAPQRWFVSVND